MYIRRSTPFIYRPFFRFWERKPTYRVVSFSKRKKVYKEAPGRTGLPVSSLDRISRDQRPIDIGFLPRFDFPFFAF